MKTLIVQMGHWGRTSGSTGTAGEQAMAHAVALAIQHTAPTGWQARLIKADASDADYRGGNAFVAIHGDGSDNHLASGASVGYRDGAGQKLATAWKTAYKKSGWPYSFKRDNYTEDERLYYGTGHAINEGTTPAIIIEVGMMTNSRERAWIDKSHLKIARSVWLAVAPEAFAVGGRYRVIVEKTLMYAGPSIHTKPVFGGKLKKGRVVTQLSPESSGGWFKAKRYWTTGYVYANYFVKE